MALIHEALARLRHGNIEAQRQQRTDFIRSLPLPVAENVGVLAVVLNSINRGFPDARFSLIGQRALGRLQFEGPPSEVDFFIINDAKAGTPLRARALDFLNSELSRYFTSTNGSPLRLVDETEAYKVMEICYGPVPTRFFIPGKNMDDSYTLKAAADIGDDRSVLLYPKP